MRYDLLQSNLSFLTTIPITSPSANFTWNRGHTCTCLLAYKCVTTAFWFFSSLLPLSKVPLLLVSVIHLHPSSFRSRQWRVDTKWLPEISSSASRVWCTYVRMCLYVEVDTFVSSNYERVPEHGDSLLFCSRGGLSGHQLAPGLLKTLLRHAHELIKVQSLSERACASTAPLKGRGLGYSVLCGWLYLLLASPLAMSDLCECVCEYIWAMGRVLTAVRIHSHINYAATYP